MNPTLVASVNLPWMEPIDAAASLGGQLLDGQGLHPEAQYAFLGLHATEKLVVKEGTINGEPCDVIATLRRKFTPTSAKAMPHPWTGGWLGYFGYEFTRYIEPTLQIASAETPDAVFEWFATGIVFDHEHQTVTAYGTKANLKKVSGSWRPTAPAVTNLNIAWTPHTSKANYKESVRKVKDWIREGDLFQANISTRFDAQALEGEAVFRHMLKQNPSPYMCYLRYGDHTIVSNSPEQLFATSNGTIRTRPIAGTRPRGQTPDEDTQLAIELRTDAKEKAEHMMLVDLLRNDVSKVSHPGTTEVTEWMSIERYSHVMHLVSQVSGALRPDADVMDCMQAIFPGGTITGAPKHRACKRIAETEPVPRGPYTGSAGFINHAGEASFNIMIRTMTITNKSMVHAGAGIVMDSDPEREWDESVQKASAFLNRPGGQVPGAVERFESWQPPIPAASHPARVLLVDNYDSFVENLRDYCEILGAVTKVIRNDTDWQAAVDAFAPTHIILSPGPGHPLDSGATLDIAKSNLTQPILGVCLGHQALALSHGGEISIVPAIHGKTDSVNVQGNLFGNLGPHVQVARYHSLIASLPTEWKTTASLQDGTLMAMQRGNRHGVQFHPESMGTPGGLQMLANFLQPTLFETVRIKGGEPIRLDLHTLRLLAGAQLLGIPAPKLPDTWNYPDGLVRIEFGGETSVHVRPLTEAKPLRLTIAPSVSIMTAKTLESRRQEVPPTGFDDFIYLNGAGTIGECSFRNVLCLHEGTLYAPGPASGALAGTTRTRLLEAWNGPVQESLALDQEGEWVATSVSGVCPVVFLQRPLPVGPFLEWCREVLHD